MRGTGGGEPEEPGGTETRGKRIAPKKQQILENGKIREGPESGENRRKPEKAGESQ